MGVTPEGVEVPICSVDKKMQEVMRKMPEDVRPVVPTGPDRKWRYMWRIGPRPQKTQFQVWMILNILSWRLWGYLSTVDDVAMGYSLVAVNFILFLKSGPNFLIFLSDVGAEFWTSGPREFPWMGGDNEWMGWQNDQRCWGGFSLPHHWLDSFIFIKLFFPFILT